MLMPVRILAAVGLAIAVVMAPLAAAPPARAATHSVQIGDGFFSPANLTVTVGDTVTWTNTDDSPHTVTATDGAFDAGNLDGGATFSQTFTSAGTFTYVCSYHDEMAGTITVVAATQSGTGAAPAATTAPPPPNAAAGATDAGSAQAGAPPDTAVPTAGGQASWIGQLLIGLGLVALAFGLFPVRRLAPAGPRRSAGWRR